MVSPNLANVNQSEQSTSTVDQHTMTGSMDGVPINTVNAMSQTDITYVNEVDPNEQAPLQNIQIVQITDVTAVSCNSTTTAAEIHPDVTEASSEAANASPIDQVASTVGDTTMTAGQTDIILSQNLEELVVIGTVGEVVVDHSDMERESEVLIPTDTEVHVDSLQMGNAHLPSTSEAAEAINKPPAQAKNDSSAVKDEGLENRGESGRPNKTSAAQKKSTANKWQVPKKGVRQYGTRSQKKSG